MAMSAVLGDAFDGTGAAVGELFDAFDVDSDGAVDLAELCAGMSVVCGGDAEARVRCAFSLFDFDGDGTISPDEMTRYLAERRSRPSVLVFCDGLQEDDTSSPTRQASAAAVLVLAEIRSGGPAGTSRRSFAWRSRGIRRSGTASRRRRSS